MSYYNSYGVEHAFLVFPNLPLPSLSGSDTRLRLRTVLLIPLSANDVQGAFVKVLPLVNAHSNSFRTTHNERSELITGKEVKYATCCNTTLGIVYCF